MMVLDASLATQGLSNSDDQEQDLHQSRSNQDWDATPGHLSRFALASAPGERDANLPGEPRLCLRDPQGPPPREGEARNACSTLAGHECSVCGPEPLGVAAWGSKRGSDLCTYVGLCEANNDIKGEIQSLGKG